MFSCKATIAQLVKRMIVVFVYRPGASWGLVKIRKNGLLFPLCLLRMNSGWVFQNSAVVCLQFPQRVDVMLRIVVRIYISDKSTSEN